MLDNVFPTIISEIDLIEVMASNENPSDNSIPPAERQTNVALVTSPTTTAVDDKPGTTSTADSATASVSPFTTAETGFTENPASTDGTSSTTNPTTTTFATFTDSHITDGPLTGPTTTSYASLSTSPSHTTGVPVAVSGFSSSPSTISFPRTFSNDTFRPAVSRTTMRYEREDDLDSNASTRKTPSEIDWRDWSEPGFIPIPFIPKFNTPIPPPPPVLTPVCEFGKTPAWQFIKCKAKQVQGNAAKWIREKSECLSKLSKGVKHAMEQTRQCLLKITVRSNDINEQLKNCFTGGDNRMCFTGLGPRAIGRSPTPSQGSAGPTAVAVGKTAKQLPEDFP
ncbi:hypothetical protein BIW11_12700 [Tropilaelaps mercedesae]|uniref:Uncharacterized protein n=1 Tax=Tropilaelaps mercedesae TaxID=418985 RepID=A0A1V9X5S7_9ACAR|nr:hypothetical protein BIW11_12700 [Tropilaelaps mercedesae]